MVVCLLAPKLRPENLVAMKKILFAMIVPFWNRETGAQQRIFSMVQALKSHGHEVRIFFPGHSESSDRATAEQLGLDVAFPCSDQPVAVEKSLARKIKWQIKAVKHAVRTFIGVRSEAADKRRTLRLSDFQWPWAEAAFKSTVIEFAPDAILCEYITMAYLVQSLPDDLRSKIHCMVDTHDLLSHRQQTFEDHDQPHWISVSPEEEAVALRVFDTIIAIQDEEAHAFEKMVPSSAVVVVGHQTLVEQPALDATASDAETENANEVFTLGYLGSGNASNVDAVSNFLDVVWRNFQDEPRIKLVLAGNACDEVVSDLRFGNVTLLGRVKDVSAFYKRVDAVINPVGYGTGLKIKSVEAIAYGKPLLCTSAGWAGSLVGGVKAVDQLPEMTEVIRHWFKERESFDRVRTAALASSQRPADHTYLPLLKLLN